MAFSNLILARGDIFLYFYPYWQAAADALSNGRIPLWNSDIFMGSPLLANSQMGFFYPLNWPLWLLIETPYAINASILLHIGIAGIGAYFAGRKALHLGPWASLLTALLFALGGYLTAQVEHINQVQGLAWLPWYLVVVGYCGAGGQGRRRGRVTVAWASLAFAFLFAMQLLAGHTQTTFISGVTVAVWLVSSGLTPFLLRKSDYALHFSFHWKRLKKTAPVALVLGGLLALLLTAVQLLPTLELIQNSSRAGGLSVNEVLSFSLNPLLLTRTLLPAYGQPLFSEYVAFVPITAVLLGTIGAWQWRRWVGVLPALLLVGMGLFLALGVFNPANWLVARLPLFNLFRVPARWLVVYTLGIALLAGVGWQVAEDRWLQRSRSWAELPSRTQENLAHIERPLRVGMILIIGLMAWNVIANILSFFVPTSPEAPFALVKTGTLFIWFIELILSYYLLTGERLVYNHSNRFRIGNKGDRLPDPKWLFLLLASSLFWGSRTQPYNNVTTPEAFFDLRPPISRLQAATCDQPRAACDVPPDRFLSLSNIFFDVGDQAEIDTIYGDQLPEAARYDYTVAIKNKEIIAPNLPMIFGLASVDGFDGGILPLQSYTALMQLILPEGVQTTDGRLRENLDAVPEAKWLDLFNAKYIITDKTEDTWRDGVFFDLQNPVQLRDEAIGVGDVPQFGADGLWILASALPGDVLLETAVSPYTLTPEQIGDGLYAVTFPETITATAITISACATTSPCTIAGLTLVNAPEETFQPLVLGAYRIIHSGDVKIYENLDVLPRAFFVPAWQWQPDVTSSVTALQAPDFSPRQTAVLIGNAAENGGNGEVDVTETAVTITQTSPEQMVLQTENREPALLLLTEAFYPGWQATIDGDPTPIYQADAYFQAIFLPAGTHEIIFSFEPDSFRDGRILTLIGLTIVVALISILFTSYRRESVKRKA